MLGSKKEYITESGFIFRAGGGRRKVSKKEFSFLEVGIPVCFRIIIKGSRRLRNSGEIRN